MRIIKYISIVLVLIIGVTQCKLPDNIDPKNPTEVPIETLFTNAEVALLNQVDECNVNLNTTRLLVQYWQQTTYFDESRYLFLDRQIPDSYTREFYRDALMDLKRTKELLEDWGGNEVEKTNKIAIATILEVYGWQCVVDAFGDMPYTEALMLSENSQPVYDDAAFIYSDIISKLEVAMSTLNTSGASYGGADVLYGGNVAAWKKFGASLQMRLGMRLADKNVATAKATFEAGNANGFADQSESAILDYVGVVPNVNAIYTAFTVDGRSDYLPTNTIIDLMNSMEDPRLPLFFTTVDDGAGNQIYLGAVAGLDGAQTYQNFSNFSAPFFEATFAAIVQDYVELEFLRAEAAERGFAVSGTAEEHYNNAITESILYWGGTQADVDTYLARTDVAYSTATGTWKQKIGTQKYIALYNRGVEGWAEWRRLDFPIINIPEGMSANDLPMRYPYPYNEDVQNKVNYEAAVAKMGGTDDRRQKIFWDVN